MNQHSVKQAYESVSCKLITFTIGPDLPCLLLYDCGGGCIKQAEKALDKYCLVKSLNGWSAADVPSMIARLCKSVSRCRVQSYSCLYYGIVPLQ